MQSHHLVCKKIVELDNSEKLTLTYFLVEEHKLRTSPLYGIQIIQEGNSNNTTSEYTEPISYSKSYVLNILSKLISNNVLVSHLLEIIDDLVS